MKRVTVFPLVALSFILKRPSKSNFARTQRDKKRPLLHVETPPREVLEALANERNPLYEEIADVTIRTDDQSAKVVCKPDYSHAGKQLILALYTLVCGYSN